MYFGTDSRTGEVVWRYDLENISQYVVIPDDEMKSIVMQANQDKKLISIGDDGRPVLTDMPEDIIGDATIQIYKFEKLLKDSDYKIIKAYEYFLATGEQLQEYDMTQLHAERDNYRLEINKYRAIAGNEK